MRLGRSISPVLKTDLPTNAQRGRAEFALTATLSAKSQANAHWHSTPWKHAAMDSHTTTRDWARVGWPSARPSSSPSRSLLDSKGACAFGSKRRSRASDAPDALEKVAQDSWYEFSSPSSRLRRLPGPHGCRCRPQVCHSEFGRQGVPPAPTSPCLRSYAKSRGECRGCTQGAHGNKAVSRDKINHANVSAHYARARSR